MTRAAAFLALALAAVLPGPGLAAPRYAVVVGNDEGGGARPRLWYAERDAERFGRTLVELGDFPADQVTVLRGATLAGVRDALARTEERVARARTQGAHPLLVFYFSGHAGSGGIELGRERLGFDELRELISRSSADAKVGIVDACEAGLLTQVKGATAVATLDFALPPDEGVRGTAFIASTAVGEVAQESAALGGSFFTHHLEVALRGAGDADGDGLVTLNEAFRYTAAQTLTETLTTYGGAQHATYEFKMSGRGDVVLSDLRRADARLTVPRDPDALYVVRGPASLLAEVAGTSQPVTLALPAGRYRIERRGDDGRAETELVLAHGAVEALPSLTPTRYEVARAKGGPKPGLVFAGAGIMRLGIANFGVAPVARVGVRKEVGAFGVRLKVEYLAHSVTDAGLRYDLSYVGGAAALLYPLNASRILVEAGPELGFGRASQRLADRRSFESSVLSAGAAVMVTAPFGPVRVGLDAAVAAQAMRVDFRDVVHPSESLSLLVLWGF